MKKILFILKYRHNYGHDGISLSSGLKNSVEMLVNMLNTYYTIEAKFAVVVDNNSIDKEVTIFKPDIVVVEAIWVVPEKFDVLKKLHPNVKWIVRNHSKTEFLANEGIAFEWIPRYISKGIIIGCNSIETTKDLRRFSEQCTANKKMIEYLPNYYPIKVPQNLHRIIFGDTINIGCFGAIRPLKNQLNQALASIIFAEEEKVKVNFHINTSRVEQRGEPILKNIRNLFLNSSRAVLVEHEWLEHEDFLDLVSEMDILLQVSFSETFDIVAADGISMGVPVIVSPHIDWLNVYAYVTDIEAQAIKDCISDLYNSFRFVNLLRVYRQQKCLLNYSKEAEQVWKHFILK